MSGVTIVNQLMFVYFLCIFGAVSGAGLFTAQFYGKGDNEGIRQTFRYKLYSALILCAAAVTLFLTCGENLMQLYLRAEGEGNAPALVMHYARQYLAVVMVGMLPTALTQVYSCTLRECGHATPPMVAGIVGVAVNGTLNYVLIFGKFGAPVMGVRGAALATVIARFTELALVMIWTHTHTKKCRFAKGLYRSFRISGGLARRIFFTGTPLLLNETFWAMAQAMLMQCYSAWGTDVVPALSISNAFFDTASVLYMSLGTAIAIVLGQTLGASGRDKAREDAPRLMTLSLLTGFATTAVIFAMDIKDFQIPRLGRAQLDSPLDPSTAFIDDGATVAYDSDAAKLAEYVRKGKTIPAFELAGPRARIYHDPSWCKAAVLTAGGLCPGLNDVIKFLTSTLRGQYKVPIVYGIRYGYRGLNPASKLAPIVLTDENTDDIHEQGGTILGSSRGEEDTGVMVRSEEHTSELQSH